MSPKASESTAPRPRGRPGKSRPGLLEAAITEFAEKGYEGATTAGIARRARSNQPLVHHHFGTKEKLFHLVLDELFAELERALVPPPGEAIDLRGIVSRFVLFTAKRPELARIWVIESGRGGKHADYMLDKHVRPLTDRMIALLGAAGAEAIGLDADPQLIVYALQGLASYPFLVAGQVKRLAHGNPRDPAFAERYADLVVDLIFRGR